MDFISTANYDDDALLLPFGNLDNLVLGDDWDLDFSQLNQPYLFPNPKEMAQAGNADFIQPGLLQLQPSLEEIMKSLDDGGPGYYDPPLQAAANLGSDSRDEVSKKGLSGWI